MGRGALTVVLAGAVTVEVIVPVFGTSEVFVTVDYGMCQCSLGQVFLDRTYRSSCLSGYNAVFRRSNCHGRAGCDSRCRLGTYQSINPTCHSASEIYLCCCDGLGSTNVDFVLKKASKISNVKQWRQPEFCNLSAKLQALVSRTVLG